jgi:hypothetical protein
LLRGAAKAAGFRKRGQYPERGHVDVDALFKDARVRSSEDINAFLKDTTVWSESGGLQKDDDGHVELSLALDKVMQSFAASPDGSVNRYATGFEQSIACRVSLFPADTDALGRLPPMERRPHLPILRPSRQQAGPVNNRHS